MTAEQKKNNVIIVAAIVIVLILVLSGVYYGIIYFGEKPKNIVQQEKIPVIDDQISPGGDQALLVEINRIRHRGIIEAMLDSGPRMPSPPSFFYSCTRDGNTFVSKDVSAAGGASNEQLFTTWDTMGQENRMQEDIAEEQATVDVSISIWEEYHQEFLDENTMM